MGHVGRGSCAEGHVDHGSFAQWEWVTWAMGQVFSGSASCGSWVKCPMGHMGRGLSVP